MGPRLHVWGLVWVPVLASLRQVRDHGMDFPCLSSLQQFRDGLWIVGVEAFLGDVEFVCEGVARAGLRCRAGTGQQLLFLFLSPSPALSPASLS